MKFSLKHNSLFILLILMLFISCGGDQRNQKGKSVAQIQEELIEYNRNSAMFEEKVIENYIENHDLTMLKTGTGLWYNIENQGKGDSLLDGQLLSVDYKVYMLNDSLCYSSEKTGPYQFKLGMADIETGIHEGMKLMKKGGKASFIIPSHLAHGLMGDMNKIPPKTPVIYKVHLLEVQ